MPIRGQRYVASLTIVAVLGLLADAALAKGSVYRDPNYGFSFKVPKFKQLSDGSSLTPVMISAPQVGGFSANINVTVQRITTNRAAYREMTVKGFKQMKFTVYKEDKLTVSGRKALMLEYGGVLGDKSLRFIALAVIDKDRVYVLTCTALKSHFKKYRRRFIATLKTFRLP